jgi:hypothetical protein
MRNLYLIIILLLVLPLGLGAQGVQRTVLLEHFTNTDCGPCTALNPRVQRFVDTTSLPVILINYHPNFPGPQDPFYLHNTAHNTTRRNYYGVNAVPRHVVDGSHFNGSPQAVYSNTTGPSDTILNRFNYISPFEIEVDATLRADDSIEVALRIHAVQAVSGKLRAFLVLTETDLKYAFPPGSNGETEFYYTMRQMLLGAAGQALDNFAAGDRQTINLVYKRNALYVPGNLQVVGFVQDSSTKTIHQAAVSPFLVQERFDLDFAANFEPIRISPANTSRTYEYVFEAEQAGSYVFRASHNGNSSWGVSMTVGGQTTSDSLVLNVTAGTPVPISLTITPGSSGVEAIGSVTVTPTAPALKDRYVLKVDGRLISGPKNLMVAYNTTTGVESSFQRMFNAAGQSYASIPFDYFKQPLYSDLLASGIPNLVVNTSFYTGTGILPTADINTYISFLNAGGKVLFTGSDVAYTTTTTSTGSVQRQFIEDFLGARYGAIRDEPTKQLSIRHPSEPVLGDLPGGSLLVQQGLVVQPNTITAFGSGVPILNFGAPENNVLAGVRNQNDSLGWKTAFLSLRMEIIQPNSFADSVMTRILRWFDGDIDADDWTVPADSLPTDTIPDRRADLAHGPSPLRMYPNPTTDWVLLDGLTPATDLTVRILSATGQEVARHTWPAQAPQLPLSVEALPTGLYRVVVAGAAPGELPSGGWMHVVR